MEPARRAARAHLQPSPIKGPLQEHHPPPAGTPLAPPIAYLGDISANSICDSRVDTRIVLQRAVQRGDFRFLLSAPYGAHSAQRQ